MFHTESRKSFIMKATVIFKELREFCIANADEAIVKKYARYFKDNYDAYGVASPLLSAKIKEVAGRDGMNLELVYELAPLLMKSGKYEETSMALHLLDSLHKQFTKETFSVIASWFSLGIYNWAHADMLGMWILPDLVKQKVVETEDFRPWLYSGFKFQRRCVPVTLIKSLKAIEDFNVLFDFIDPLMSDPEREVHQGTGWLLREAWKKNPDVTEKFLMKYKKSAPRLIIQYATEKMSKEDRLKYRREK